MTKAQYQNVAGEQGTVKIAEDVIASIAKIAATEVQGASGMTQKLFGKTPFAKEVEIQFYGNRVSVALSLLVEYGFTVPEVAKNVQEAVRTAVQSMTGMHVESVDIHVQGIVFPQASAGDEAEIAD